MKSVNVAKKKKQPFTYFTKTDKNKQNFWD